MTDPSTGDATDSAPPLATFHVDPGATEGASTLRVRGEVDLSNAGDLDLTMRQATAGKASLTLDLAGVSYLDSAAVRVLFAHSRQIALSVRIAADSTIRDLLAMCGLDQVAAVYCGD